ncbi:porin [Roseomonas sp. NAR14]|uniref:Porin n=1 Tax=Roseomonas acroporae TaxID=2937791 RepID=A0A9X1YE08_9PROT|nr:porin [Roseomonas acroporae]MCK8784696.1 porin [Roseomonas acroporae]
MRKILLGTTAVVGAALLGAGTASAQQAPTVRIGGYFNFFTGYTQQTSANANNVPMVTSPGDNGTGSNGTSTVQNGSVRTNKWDMRSDAEVHVFVDGKTANGISYGAVIELEVDASEGQLLNSRRNTSAKTGVSTDEMYGFIATPLLGQIRYGDEDGVLGGLMNTGVVTNFGTGGVYGEWQNFVIRSGPRTTTSPGDLGDATKVIYLSPQFFGFDFGASFAPNQGQGSGNGCIQNIPTYTCDRAITWTGATANGVNHDNYTSRRNEYQVAGRWRGTLGGIGLAVSGGYIGSGAPQDINTTGTVITRGLNGLGVAYGGIQATAYGFTLGANYQHGDGNFFWQPTVRGSRAMDQWMIGASYTIGPVTFGGNFVTGTYAGNQGNTVNTTTGAFVTNNNTAQARQQRRYGMSFGGNYRLAPGLDIVAEYTNYRIRERGVDLDGIANNGVQDRLRADVFILGTRLAF